MPAWLRSSCLIWLCLTVTLPAVAQEIVPFGDAVVLAEGCTLSPVTVESGGQVVALWSETESIAARVGPTLAALGPAAPIHSPASFVPSVAALGQPGGFVAAWTSFLPEDNAVMVLFQRFGLDLQPLGSAVVLESVEGFYQRPQLASLPDGSFVLAYVRELAGNEVSVRARRFAADGTPLTGTIEVGIGTTSSRDISLAAAGGAFALAWTSDEAHLRVVALDGQLLGSEILLGPGFGRVVPAADAFVALRMHDGALAARKVGFDGGPLGAETPLADLVEPPFDLLAAGGDGAVWLAWIAEGGFTLMASRLDPAALTLSPPAPIAALPAAPQSDFLIGSALRAMPGGRFAASWQVAHNSVILPTPCDFGISAHAGIFGTGSPVVEVPALGLPGALLLGALLAAAGLLLLARGR